MLYEEYEECFHSTIYTIKKHVKTKENRRKSNSVIVKKKLTAFKPHITYLCRITIYKNKHKHNSSTKDMLYICSVV